MAESTIATRGYTAQDREETPQPYQYAQEVLALTRRWYIMLVREKLNLALSIAQPALWLIFFGSGLGRVVDKDAIATTDYTAFTLPGLIAFTVVGNGVSGAMPLLWDKEQGYLDKLMSMPIGRTSVIVSRFVFQVGLGTVQAVAMLAVALAMGVDIAAGVPGILMILVASAFLTLALSALATGLAYRVPGHGTFFAVTGFITLPLLFMSNAFVPLDAMPRWMEIVARCNPLTYAIEAMRVLVLDGWETSLLWSFGALAAIALGCLGLGAYQFHEQTADRLSDASS